MQRSSPGNTATAHVARAPTAPVVFTRGSPPGLGPGGLCGIAVPQLSPPPPEAEPALRQLSRSGMLFDASAAFRVAAIQRPAGATRPAPSRRAEPTGLAHVLRMCAGAGVDGRLHHGLTTRQPRRFAARILAILHQPDATTAPGRESANLSSFESQQSRSLKKRCNDCKDLG